jgi:hypothetical protein
MQLESLAKCPFLNAKANLSALGVYKRSHNNSWFIMDLRSCYVEAGEFPKIGGPWGH